MNGKKKKQGRDQKKVTKKEGRGELKGIYRKNESEKEVKEKQAKRLGNMEKKKERDREREI